MSKKIDGFGAVAWQTGVIFVVTIAVGGGMGILRAATQARGFGRN